MTLAHVAGVPAEELLPLLAASGASLGVARAWLWLWLRSKRPGS